MPLLCRAPYSGGQTAGTVTKFRQSAPEIGELVTVPGLRSNVDRAMVDIHSHVVWGLDDGATDMEQSLAMLRAAADSGTTDIVATPHSNAEFRYQAELLEERMGRSEEHMSELQSPMYL